MLFVRNNTDRNIVSIRSGTGSLREELRFARSDLKRYVSSCSLLRGCLLEKKLCSSIGGYAKTIHKVSKSLSVPAHLGDFKCPVD